MTTTEALTLVALLLGPLAAVGITIWRDARREDRSKRLDLFRTLMATRGNHGDFGRVRALNLVDVEFYKSKKVRKAWQSYFEHLNTAETDPGWNDKESGLSTDLLAAMAADLCLDLDAAYIKRMNYKPKLHGQIEEDQRAVAKSLKEVLSGVRPLWVAPSKPPQMTVQTSAGPPTTPPEMIGPPEKKSR